MKHICHISIEKNNIAFIKLFETLFGSVIFASFIDFECQGIILVLFESKLLKFKMVCYLHNFKVLL